MKVVKVDSQQLTIFYPRTRNERLAQQEDDTKKALKALKWWANGLELWIAIAPWKDSMFPMSYGILGNQFFVGVL